MQNNIVGSASGLGGVILAKIIGVISLNTISEWDYLGFCTNIFEACFYAFLAAAVGAVTQYWIKRLFKI